MEMDRMIDAASYGPAWVGLAVLVAGIAGAAYWFRKDVKRVAGKVGDKIDDKADEVRSRFN